MRKMKFAQKQKETQSIFDPSPSNSEPMSITRASPPRKKSNTPHSIFLNAEEAAIWIKREFTRKHKNELLEIIRKRNLAELTTICHDRTVPFEIQRRHNSISLRKYNFTNRMKEQSSRDRNISHNSLNSFQLGKTKKYSETGFLTIQTLNTTQPTEQFQQNRIRVRTEKNSTRRIEKLIGERLVGCESAKEGGRKKCSSVGKDMNGFHISQIGPWE